MRYFVLRSFFMLAVLFLLIRQSAAAPGDLLQTFQKPIPAADDQLGRSVALVDGRVLIGTYADDTWETNSGAVYLFDVDGTLLQTFFSPNPAVSGSFGYSVTGIDDRILIGANYDNGGRGQRICSA